MERGLDSANVPSSVDEASSRLEPVRGRLRDSRRRWEISPNGFDPESGGMSTSSASCSVALSLCVTLVFGTFSETFSCFSPRAHPPILFCDV